MAKEKSKELKLRIELVPSTSWYENLRKHIDRNDWEQIRHKVYADYENRCGICGAEGRLNCHETWEYNDKNHVQRLLGFIALCDMCHHVKHIGLSGILARRGELDYEKVIEHFMRVNNCDRIAFENHFKAAREQWIERSGHNWRVDLSDYQSMVKNIK